MNLHVQFDFFLSPWFLFINPNIQMSWVKEAHKFDLISILQANKGTFIIQITNIKFSIFFYNFMHCSIWATCTTLLVTRNWFEPIIGEYWISHKSFLSTINLVYRQNVRLVNISNYWNTTYVNLDVIHIYIIFPKVFNVFFNISKQFSNIIRIGLYPKQGWVQDMWSEYTTFTPG